MEKGSFKKFFTLPAPDKSLKPATSTKEVTVELKDQGIQTKDSKIEKSAEELFADAAQFLLEQEKLGFTKETAAEIDGKLQEVLTIRNRHS